MDLGDAAEDEMQAGKARCCRGGRGCELAVACGAVRVPTRGRWLVSCRREPPSWCAHAHGRGARRAPRPLSGSFRLLTERRRLSALCGDADRSTQALLRSFIPKVVVH